MPERLVNVLLATEMTVPKVCSLIVFRFNGGLFDLLIKSEGQLTLSGKNETGVPAMEHLFCFAGTKVKLTSGKSLWKGIIFLYFFYIVGYCFQYIFRCCIISNLHILIKESIIVGIEKILGIWLFIL